MNSQIIQVLRDHLPQRLLSKIGIERTLHRKQSSRVSCVNEFMLAKFEGTLLGALIGDCVGKRIESIWGPNLHEMLDDFRTLRTSHEENDDLYVDEENIREYTDDMAMTMSVCDSLVACADFDMIDVADRFQRTFATNPNRGYSSNAIVLFRKLSKYKRVNELKDRCLQPAMELFHGEGSYGNGGAMRCAPIALFTCMRTTDEMKAACELATRITHTHIWSLVGSLQQCYAIRLLLITNKLPNAFDFNDYFSRVINFVHDLEKKFEMQDMCTKDKMHTFTESMQSCYLLYLEQKRIFNAMHSGSDDLASRKEKRMTHDERHRYSNLMQKLRKQYQKCRRGDLINIQRLHKHVATTGISAMESIPVALFSFVVASDPRCANEVNFKLGSEDAFAEYSPVERVVFYAISYGGDSHKIASMAGALAGAFFSAKDLPRYILDMCESSEDMCILAQKVFDISVPNEFEFMSSDKGDKDHQIETTVSLAHHHGPHLHTSPTMESITRSTLHEKAETVPTDEPSAINMPNITSNDSLETKASSSSSCSV